MDSEEGFDDDGQVKTDDLSTFDFEMLTGSGDANTWCDQCKIYQQEKERLEKEYAQKFNTLKKKIISTDLLIKKYKKKCEDYDILSKELTESNNKKEQYRRESEVLKTQLTSALTQLEPTKRTNVNLETELKTKHKEIQELKDKLSAQEVIHRQYDLLSSSSSDYKQRMETMQKEHSKTIKELETRNQKQESQTNKLKEEAKATKMELASTRKAQVRDASNLKKSVTRMETYFQILKDNGLLPKGHKRLRVETYFSGTDCVEEEISQNDSIPRDDTSVMRKDDMEDDNDEDDDSFPSIPWTFSPLVNPLSPLPPTPKPHKDDSEEEDNAVGSDNSIDDMADQLENELLNLSTSQQTSEHTSQPERHHSSPLSPIALHGQSTTKPPTSPLSQSLRERVLLKSNRQHMTIIEKKNITASENFTVCTTVSKDNITMSVLGSSENLSDSDEENKNCHSNIIKCDKFVKHENSAFIKFIKPETKHVENYMTDSVKTVCEKNLSVNKLAKTDSFSKQESKDEEKSGKERKGLLRSDTGSFDLSEVSEKISENNETSAAKTDIVTSAVTEKVDTSDIENGAITLSPNRPVTRTLTRSLSLSSDSLLDREHEELSPGKRKARAKTNCNINTDNPSGNAADSLCSIIVPRLDDLNKDTSQRKSVVTSDVKTACQTTVGNGSVIDKNLSKTNRSDAFTGRISEISEEKDVTNGTKPDGGQVSGMMTRSRNESVEKQTSDLNREVSFMRSKGRSKIPSGKSLKESFVSVKESDIPITDGCNHLSTTQSINSPNDCSVSFGKKRIAHKVKQPECKLDCEIKTSVQDSKDEECMLKEEQSLHTDSMKSKEDSSDITCLHSEDGSSTQCLDASCDKMQTRSMSRQCSTGFVLKSPPLLSGEKSKTDHLLDGIAENEVTEDQKNVKIEKIGEKEVIENDDVKNILHKQIDIKIKSDGEIIHMKELQSTQKKESFEEQNQNSKLKEKLDNEEEKSRCSVQTNISFRGEVDITTSDIQTCPSDLVSVMHSHEEPFVKSSTNTISVSNISLTVKEIEKKENVKSDSLRTGYCDVSRSSPAPSSSKALIYSPANIVPSTSSLLKSTLNRSFVTSHSSGIVSPELASLSQRGADETHSPPQSMTSMSPSSPVSPLPPSPFDFYLPMPISPLPPSPVRNTRPLSPLPGSPASSDTDSLPTATSLSGVAHTPMSDRSSESSPVCTPVSFLTPLAATPKHRDSAITPPSHGSSKASSSTPLCSFHSQAPPDAITVRPHHGCAAASYKRSLSPSFDDARSVPDKSIKGEKLNKSNIKRRSVDSKDVPNVDVSKEKRPCLSNDKVGEAKNSQTGKPGKDGVTRQPSTNQQKHSIEKDLESIVNKFLFDKSISSEQVSQQIVADLKATVTVFINWLVQKLRCSEIELLSSIVSHCEESGPTQPRSEPFLATGEMRLLQLINHLFKKTDWKSSKEKLMRSLWTAIFLRDVVTQAARSALCRIFAGIAKSEGDIEQVRVLFFHILTCGYLNGPLLGVTIAGVWPKALYRDNSGASPVLVVMEHCLMQMMAENREKYEKVVLCLMKLCDWSASAHTTSALLSHLLNALEEKTSVQNGKDGVFELHRSLELLLAMQKPSFFKVHFTQTALKDLNGKITRGKKCNKIYIHVILQVTAGFISSRAKELGQAFCQQSIRKYFLQILNNKSALQETKDSVLTTLLEISHVAPMCVMTYGLHVWYIHNKDVIPSAWVQRMESTRKILIAHLPKFKCLPFV